MTVDHVEPDEGGVGTDSSRGAEAAAATGCSVTPGSGTSDGGSGNGRPWAAFVTPNGNADAATVEPPTGPAAAGPGGGATETRACTDGLEPTALGTTLVDPDCTPTVAPAAAGAADAETDAEATGVETLAVAFGATVVEAGSETLAETVPALGSGTVADAETLGVVTDGLETFGVVTAGVVTFGVEATGVVTEGVVTAGVETAGVLTLGVDTGGVVTGGVEIVVGVGVETVGVETAVVAPIVGRIEVVRLPIGSPSPNAAPANPPHARIDNAATDEALRRRARPISRFRSPVSWSFKRAQACRNSSRLPNGSAA